MQTGVGPIQTGRRELHRYTLFSILVIAWMTCMLDRSAIAYGIIPMQKEFHLDPAAVGLVFSVFFWGYVLVSVPAGWLCDKIGSKKILVIAIVGFSVFTLGTGYAWSFASLIAVRFLFGIAEGPFPTAGQKAIAEYFPAQERVKASAIIQAATLFGNGAAPIIIVPLIVWIGWRAGFAAISVVGIIIAIVMWFSFHEVNRNAVGRGEGTGKRDIVKAPFRAVCKNVFLWKVVVMFFGCAVILWSFNSWMPMYFVKTRGVNIMKMSYMAFLPYGVSGLTTIASGWLLQGWFRGREKYFAALGMFGSVACLLYMYADSGLTVRGALICWNLVYIFKSFTYAAAFTLPHMFLPKEVIGTSVGMINTASMIAGSIAPLMLGIIIKYSSYNVAFMVLSGFGVLSMLAALSINKKETSVNFASAAAAGAQRG
jgi:MFS family permease